jgi:hypothetical protein
MPSYIDCYRLWNDFFPFGRLLADYYWVLEGIDDDDDGLFETASCYVVGSAVGYSIETVWGEIQDSIHMCSDGSQLSGKRVTFNAQIRLALSPLTQSVAATLEVYGLNCSSGELTPGVPLQGDLAACLRNMFVE